VLLKLTTGLRLPLSELIAIYERHRAETRAGATVERSRPDR
jgi:hypothetical protein